MSELMMYVTMITVIRSPCFRTGIYNSGSPTLQQCNVSECSDE